MPREGCANLHYRAGLAPPEANRPMAQFPVSSGLHSQAEKPFDPLGQVLHRLLMRQESPEPGREFVPIDGCCDRGTAAMRAPTRAVR
jgi:hypothetical protein